ncbi:eukaryotic initiation factor 4A-like [Clytia hemisphaerica]
MFVLKPFTTTTWSKYVYCKHQIRRCLSFTDLSLDVSLVRKLRSFEIRTPTAIQEKCCELMLKGQNLVLNSETGSGKTLAYAVPIVQRIQERRRLKQQKPHPSVVVLLPSVELCYQVGDVFRSMLGVNVSLVTSDIPMRLKNTDVVVTTPHALSTYPYNVLNETETIIIDEADILIDKRIGKHGRKDPLFRLMNHMLDMENKTFDHDRQFIFVGATMPDSEVKKSRKAMTYIRHWVPDIQMVRGDEAHMMLSRLDMIYMDVDRGNKLKYFVKAVSQLGTENFKMLVFVDTVKTAQKLFQDLTRIDQHHGSTIEKDTFPEQLLLFQKRWTDSLLLLHRDVSRDDRLTSLDYFNKSRQCILITTDVSARGLDFQDVDVVLQFDFTKNVTDLIHRVGRTARMGKQGKVINFVTTEDQRLASLIQEYSASGESLDRLFSRRRGLGKALKRIDEASTEAAL